MRITQDAPDRPMSIDESVNLFGRCHIDFEYNQQTYYRLYNGIITNIPDYQKGIKFDYPNIFKAEAVISTIVNSFNPEQRLIYNTFIEYYKAFLRSDDPLPLRMQLDSKSSINKSYIIQLLSIRLKEPAPKNRQYTNEQKFLIIIRATPTSIIANNIKSSILYLLFRLPILKTSILLLYLSPNNLASS